MKSIQEIGNTIKQERLKQGLTLQQMSAATGFSIGYLSQFERGLSQIAIDSLRKITDVLGMDFIESFTEEKPSVSDSPITRIYDADCDKVSDQIIQYTLSQNAGNYSYLPRLYHLMPHISADEEVELYSHDGEEFIYVLEGVLKLYIEDQEYIMYPGDSAQLDSTKKHNWSNCGHQVTKILTFNMPNPLK